MSLPFTRAPWCAVALMTLVAGACSDQPSAPRATPREMAFSGTLEVAARMPDGTIESRERPWSTVSNVGDLGAYSRTFTSEMAADPEAYRNLPDDQRPAPFPVLALKDGHALARWRSKRPVVNRFTEGGKEFALAIERSAPQGPPTQLTLFEDGRPLHVVRFDWQKDGDLWIAARTAVTVWKDGVPAVQLVARITGNERRLAAAPEAAAMLRAASDAVSSLVVPVLSALLLPPTAEAQLHFWGCRYQWLELMKSGAVMAAAVATAGTVGAFVSILSSLGFLQGSFDMLNDLFRLLECIQAEEAGTGGTTDPGGTPPPPLGLTTPQSDSLWVDALLAGRDRVCVPDGPHVAFCT